jgi:hypothetical protein
LHVYQFDAWKYFVRMKTCRQIRYENARALIAEDGPSVAAEKIAATSNEPMTSQQVNAWGGPNPRRGIGDDMARRIEIAYGKEEGWLDHEWSDESNLSNTGRKTRLSDEAKNLILCVERLDGAGDLARKTFTYHTGLLLLSSAATELQTGVVRSQMMDEVLRILGPAHTNSPGATNERQR